MSMTNEDILRASVRTLIRTLRSADDIQRGIRLDKAITNDGRVITDQVIGFIRMIENIDALRGELSENTINLIDQLLNIRDLLNDPVTGTFLYDPFDDDDGTLLTAHTGSLGAEWTSDGGAFTIHDGRVYGTTTGFVYASGQSPIPDYKVEAEYTYLSDSGENGIALRIQPGQATGYYMHYNVGAFKLIRQVAGVGTLLKTVPYSSASLPVTAGVAVSGNRLDIFIDGAGVASVIDGDPIVPAGRVGLRSRPISSTTGQHLDKVRGSAYVIQMKDMQALTDTITAALDDEDPPADVSDALVILNASLRSTLGAKRDVAVPIPQDEVVNLPQTITGVLTDLADKVNRGEAIPQATVTGLVTELNNIATDQQQQDNAIASKATPADLTLLENALQGSINQVSGDVSTLEERDRVVVMSSSDATDTSVATTVGNMSLSLTANTAYRLHAVLDMFSMGDTGGGAFAGVRFGITVPGGSTVNGAISGYVASTIPFFESITGSGLAAPAWMFDGVPMRTVLDARIDVGGTAGNLSVIWAVPGVDDIALMGAGSSMELRRLD